MSSKKERPALKFAAVLGSVAVLGIFLGYVTERFVTSDHEEEVPEVALPPPPAFLPDRPQSSEWEQTVVKRATAGLPQYPGANAAPLAADYHGAEAPIAIAWFNTKDHPSQVLNWYAAQFVDAGIPPLTHFDSENSGYVAYMVPNTGEMRMVTAMLQADQTVVFASNGNLAPLLETSKALPPGITVPPGAAEPMVVQMNQEGAADVSVYTSIEGMELEAVVNFYKRDFEQGGWTVDEIIRPNASEAHLQATREGRHAFATLKRLGAGEKVEILVRVTGRV